MKKVFIITLTIIMVGLFALPVFANTEETTRDILTFDDIEELERQRDETTQDASTLKGFSEYQKQIDEAKENVPSLPPIVNTDEETETERQRTKQENIVFLCIGTAIPIGCAVYFFKKR